MSVTPGAGAFALTAGVPIVVQESAGSEGRAVAAWFVGLIARATGFSLPVVTEPAGGAGRAVNLSLDSRIAAEEGYWLTVTPERIDVVARTGAGLFYGLQTVRQLLPPEIEAARPMPGITWDVPAVTVEDAPRFGYRGMMLDVSRHFFPVEFIKRYLDLAALYKMNRFHWHLTDDHGWRLEIRKYSRLTEVGAFREKDGVRYGGYYTQDQVREVVRYAAERFITIVPEIEMPGHCLAALAAYPEYACAPGPFAVATEKGIYDGVFCPTEETFTFLQDVLDEVFALFPGRQVHIGGDEVVPEAWRSSAAAQAVMAREGLTDAGQLAGYFLRRVAAMAAQKGRDVIGWDEILAGELPPSATVMSWRGTDGGVQAARRGHDAIMTPSAICYLQHYQADPATEPKASGLVMTLATVYAYDPIPAGLTAQEAARIVGSAGMLWTENIATPEYAEYMAYPRAIALAEVLWSPQAARTYRTFLPRLAATTVRLDILGINYAPHFRH